METMHYDVIVIGTGPGGEGAAMQAVKAGKHVAAVEKHIAVGGNCTHWGTIPSKSLRQAIQQVNLLKRQPLFQPIIGHIKVDYPQLLKRAGEVISQQVTMRQGFYDRNDIRVIHGHAAFVDAHTIKITDARGGTEHCSADTFVIATGSRPYHPPSVDFSHPHIHDSNTILQLDHTPRSVTVYGAGVIGCEYASIFRNLGIKVNLINTREKLLTFLDDEIIDALSYHLRDEGVIIRHNEEFDRVEPLNDGVILYLKSGKKLKSDVLVWANGRTGNTCDMGLEYLHIAIDHRGQLPVNEHYQTNLDYIYAVGDVVGFPSLASAAYDQGRFAIQHVLDNNCDHRLVENIPTGIYTSPEVSCIGATEKELTAQKVPYEVGRSIFRSLARAQIAGVTVGILKILFHRDTLEILGIHCFGYQAAEIIHIGQIVMSQQGPANNLMYFVNTTFNYPTMAEAYRVAALNGLNRLF